MDKERVNENACGVGDERQPVVSDWLQVRVELSAQRLLDSPIEILSPAGRLMRSSLEISHRPRSTEDHSAVQLSAVTGTLSGPKPTHVQQPMLASVIDSPAQ
jgi:hypothetical protein